MAHLDQAIHALLVADSAVTAIVGTRIYPIRAPDNAVLPMLTYQRVSNVKEHYVSRETATFTDTIFQIDCWVKQSDTIGVLRNLATAVRTVLDDYRGITSGIDIQGILSDNEFDQPWDDELKIFGVTQRYRIFHRE